MHIFLVGVNHSHQFFNEVNQIGRPCEFLKSLRQLALVTECNALGEEMSEAALQERGASTSVAAELAEELQLPHIFCDPNRSEREELVIPSEAQLKTDLSLGRVLSRTEQACLDWESRKYWPAREAFWLRKLRELDSSRVLFVLGSDHVETFTTLLVRERLWVSCMVARWEPPDISC